MQGGRLKTDSDRKPCERRPTTWWGKTSSGRARQTERPGQFVSREAGKRPVWLEQSIQEERSPGRLSHTSEYQRDRRRLESLHHRRICYWEGPQNALAWRVITKSINRKVISHQNSLISLGSRRVSHKDPKHWYTINKKPRRTFIDDRLTWNWGCTNIAFPTSLWPSGSWNNAQDNPKIFRAARGYIWRSLDLLPCRLLLSLSLPPVHTSQTLTQYLVLENSILIGLHREPA